MGLASFFGGAAKSYKKTKDTELAIQQELEVLEAKAKMHAEIQRRNELLAKGIDPTTGQAFAIYGDGTRTEGPAPQGYVDQLRAAQEAEAAERRLKQDKITAETERARADVEYKGLAGKAAERRAAASETSAAARAQADRARAGYYERGGSSGNKPKDPEAKTEKEVDAIYKEIAGLEVSDSIKAAARKIRFSSLTPAEKQQALMELFEAED